MGTKSPFKDQRDPETGAGFQLYTDFMDECAGDDVVHLLLRGAAFTASGGGGVPELTVAIPLAWADTMGFVPPGVTRHDPETGFGFVLRADTVEGPVAVSLHLRGAAFAVDTGGGGEVDVAIPRAWAEQLGLVAPRTEAPLLRQMTADDAAAAVERMSQLKVENT